jgi:hypothetical protein
MSNINANSFRLVGAGTTFLSPTDFIVQVDTSAGAVTLILPKIQTILSAYTSIQQFIGIRFVDISNNASVNNITIVGFESDSINAENNIVLNTNGVGGMISLIGTSQWNFVQNAVGGTKGGGNYLLQELPTPQYTTLFDREAIGEVYANNKQAQIIVGRTFLTLDNGDLIYTKGIFCILNDETILACGSSSIDADKNYFLALKQSTTNPSQTDLLAYCLATDNEQIITISSFDKELLLVSETELSAKIMYPTYPDNPDTNLALSFYVQLDFNSSTNTLTAQTFFPFQAPITALALYNQVTGLSCQLSTFNSFETGLYSNNALGERRIMNGTYEAYDWFVNDDTTDIPVDKKPFNYIVGINYVTGETLLIDGLEAISNLTNFDNSGNDPDIKIFKAHPKGVTLFFSNEVDVDNKNNYNGVTAIYSPLWVNNTKCIYLNSRGGIFDSVKGVFSNTGGEFANTGNADFMNFNSENCIFGKNYAYQVGTSLNYPADVGSNINIWRWKLDSEDIEFETFQIPVAWQSKELETYAFFTSNGIFTLSTSEANFIGKENYSPTYGGLFWGDGETTPIQVKSNLPTPSDFIGNKAYSLEASSNWQGMLTLIDSYDNITF